MYIYLCCYIGTEKNSLSNLPASVFRRMVFKSFEIKFSDNLIEQNGFSHNGLKTFTQQSIFYTTFMIN